LNFVAVKLRPTPIITTVLARIIAGYNSLLFGLIVFLSESLQALNID
jgi:hypothetical protein